MSQLTKGMAPVRPDPSLNTDVPPVTLCRQAPTRTVMNVSQLKEFCRGFPSSTETLYGEPYNFLVYGVGGKKFAYFKTSHPERWRFSIRVAPDRFIELTDVPGVKPARYRGRYYWITIVKVSNFPPCYLTELVEWSYQKAVASLSKAKRTAICSGADAAAPNSAVNADAPLAAPRAVPWAAG